MPKRMAAARQASGAEQRRSSAGRKVKNGAPQSSHGNHSPKKAQETSIEIPAPEPLVFNVISGVICISDPRLCRAKKGGLFNIAALNGEWEARTTVVDGEGFGQIVASLTAYCRTINAHSGASTTPIEVTVDSGQVGVFDVEIYPEHETGDWSDPTSFYGKCCDAGLSPSQGGVIDGRGVVVRSGLGDGEYQGELTMNEQGQVIGVKLVFE